MPIQQIAVVSPCNKSMDNSGSELTENGAENRRSVVPVGNQVEDCHIVECDQNVALNCDNDIGNEVALSGAAAGENVNTHVDADTVILGDMNSDSLSDDTGKQSDSGTDGHVHVQVVRPRTGIQSNENSDISNSGNVTNSDKRSQTRNTGKSSKKEKPMPVKKKDSGTQEDDTCSTIQDIILDFFDKHGPENDQRSNDVTGQDKSSDGISTSSLAEVRDKVPKDDAVLDEESKGNSTSDQTADEENMPYDDIGPDKAKTQANVVESVRRSNDVTGQDKSSDGISTSSLAEVRDKVPKDDAVLDEESKGNSTSDQTADEENMPYDDIGPDKAKTQANVVESVRRSNDVTGQDKSSDGISISSLAEVRDKVPKDDAVLDEESKGKSMSNQTSDKENETLHPNSPTPISAERCDSSMSNLDVCRICQCDTCEIQKESPLVSPCLCAGSLKFIHQACLQKWIKSSDKMSCELCQFEYQMTKKTKPFREWERLDMTPAERRKVVCSVTFHVIAITCVVWSLYVLIDRTTEEVEAGSLLWPFWTKLIVVAIGFTGGVVFMYVQCKMYLTLCKKWRTYNKVILVSSISESQRDKANHEGIIRMTEKQAQLEEERRTNFDVFTIVQETDTF